MPKPITAGRRAACLALSCTALAAQAAPPASPDPFVGTWEARVVTGPGASYTMRLRCRSASDCEMQMIDGSAQARSPDALSFKSAVPLQRGYAPARDALKYALGHRAESGPNPEFAALHKLLAVAAGAKTEIDACIGLDAKQPEFFMVCTLRGATSFRPTVLLFGSLLGLCGQGFCKHVIYPLVKTGA